MLSSLLLLTMLNWFKEIFVVVLEIVMTSFYK